jgi:hypothetical protein
VATQRPTKAQQLERDHVSLDPMWLAGLIESTSGTRVYSKLLLTTIILIDPASLKILEFGFSHQPKIKNLFDHSQ